MAEEMRFTLSTTGATIFLGVLTATYLEGVRSREDLETLIGSLTTYWSIAQEQMAGTAGLTAPTDEHNIHVLVNALISHLQMSFDL